MTIVRSPLLYRGNLKLCFKHRYKFDRPHLRFHGSTIYGREGAWLDLGLSPCAIEPHRDVARRERVHFASLQNYLDGTLDSTPVRQSLFTVPKLN